MSPSVRRNRIGGAIGLTALRVGLVGISSIGWTALVVRELSGTESGQLIVAAAWPSILSGIAAVGLPAVVIHRFTGVEAAEQTELKWAATLFTRWLAGVGSMGAIGGVALHSPTIVGLSLSAVAGGIAIGAAMAQSKLDFRAYALLATGPHAIAFALTAIAASIRLLDSLTALGILAFAYVVTGLRASLPAAHLRQSSAGSVHLLRKHLTAVRDSWLSEVAAAVRQRADVVIASTVLSYSAASSYGAAFSVAQPLGGVSVALFAVALPLLQLAPRDPQYLMQFMRLTATGTAAALLPIVIFAEPIAGFLFGHAQGDLAPLIRLISPAIMATAVSKIVTAGLQATGRFRTVAVISISTLVIAIPLMALGGAAFGVQGVAIAASVAALVNFGWRLRALGETHDIRLAGALVARPSDFRWLFEMLPRSANTSS